MPSKLVMPKPNKKQDLALRADSRYVGYGGARGGGKSWFVRWKAILLCLAFAGIKILRDKFIGLRLRSGGSQVANCILISLTA